MKKELFAALSLIILCALSVWNMVSVRNTTDELCIMVESSQEYFLAGDFPEAEKQLRIVLDRWHSPENYIYISLRHDEIDSITDTLYELLSHLTVRSKECLVAYEHLLHSLRTLAEMETPSRGSIF